MSHKLKPCDLTNLLLTNKFEFHWGAAKDRLLRYDAFINEIKAKFSIVDWNHETIEKAKIELMSLCAGPQLRDIINSVTDTAESFEEVVKMSRKRLMKDNPPLYLLASLLSETQGFTESFEDYYNRVKAAANSIDWDSFSSENIRKTLIATTVASRCHNPFVKGHCLAVRNLDSINLQDILNTAQEYEEKHPVPSSFPQVGNSGGLFGASAPGGGSGGGLFGSGPSGSGGSLFGQASKPVGVKTTAGYRYDKDGNLIPSSTNTGYFRGFSFGAAAPKPGGGLFGSAPGPGFGGAPAPQSPAPNGAGGPSFEENRTKSTLFGGTPSANNAPFGGFKTNIFMSENKGGPPKEGEASTSQTTSEGDTYAGVKRQRSDTGPADKAT